MLWVGETCTLCMSTAAATERDEMPMCSCCADKWDAYNYDGDEDDWEDWDGTF